MLREAGGLAHGCQPVEAEQDAHLALQGFRAQMEGLPPPPPTPGAWFILTK